MAEQENDINKESDINSRPTSPSSNNVNKPVDINVTELSGWLTKRTKISRKWKKTYFRLKDTDLCYGKSEDKLNKTIPLQDAQLGECSIDRKPNVFRIRPTNSQRNYYLCFESEDEQHHWMEAICFAKATGHRSDQSEACCIQ